MKPLWRRTKRPLIFLATYTMAWALLAITSPSHGLLTPDGSIHLPSAFLTGVVLILRLLSLFVVVPLLVYRAITVRL